MPDKTEYCKSGALTKGSKFLKISFLVMNICITISLKKLSTSAVLCN